MTDTAGQLLWEPDDKFCASAGVTHLMTWLREHRGLTFNSYDELWRWSVADVEVFWRALWDYFEIDSPQPPGPVLGSADMPHATWFPGTEVSYTRRMLDAGPDDAIALHHYSEVRASGVVTRGELRRDVFRLARALLRAGVKPGDCVAAYMPNTPEAVVAMLAVTGVGAVWSSCSPDFGVGSALDRFKQIEPTVLIAVDGYRYGGKDFDRRDGVVEMMGELPSVSQVIYLPYLFENSPSAPQGAWTWNYIMGGDFDADDDPLVPYLPFAHPLWIVYSSGTTGLPKGMVHSQGGVLLEHLKLQSMHLGLRPESCLFFYTTTGWIMFNLLTSALIVGASAVLYDGNPAYPDENTLWRIASETRATNFGTSPTFVNMLAQKGCCPKRDFDLEALEGVVCTGSPLTPESFSWIYDNVKSNLWVSSVSGGTDTATGFVGGVQTLPVHSGELQAPCLGVDVQAFDVDGRPVVGAEGELVVTQPMPSMPLYFWNDPDGTRYHDAYFATFAGVWRHGDLLYVTERGSYVISGRSDSTLNRHGIRIGTSEIYRTVEALEGIADSIIVHLDGNAGLDRLVLFVLMDEGAVLTDDLATDIRRRLRDERSPRHVPEDVLATPAIPYTLTGKKMEVPLKRILQGADAGKVANRDAMANPDSIPFFAELSGTFEVRS